MASAGFAKVKDEFSQLKTGTVLFADAPDAEVNSQMQFRVNIALGEPGIFDGEPVLLVLNQLHNSVKTTVEALTPLV